MSGYAAHLGQERGFFSATWHEKVLWSKVLAFFFPLLISSPLISELAEFTLHKLVFYVSYFTLLWQVAVSSGVC